MYRVHDCSDELGPRYGVFKSEDGGLVRRVALFDEIADADRYVEIMNLVAQRKDAMEKLETLDDALFDMLDA